MARQPAESIHDKTEEMLQQIRVVLPGTEALLGFQLVVFFNAHFEKLPTLAKYLHLANLMLIIVSTMLLVAPVAFRQIKEKGRNTSSFLTFTSRMLKGSMAFLMLGLSGDTYVAARLAVPEDADSAVAIILAVLVFCLGATLWFLLPWLWRD